MSCTIAFCCVRISVTPMATSCCLSNSFSIVVWIVRNVSFASVVWLSNRLDITPASPDLSFTMSDRASSSSLLILGSSILVVATHVAPEPIAPTMATMPAIIARSI